MDSDPHAETVNYYLNWPGRTKREVDLMIQYGGNDWPQSKIPIPDPRFVESFDPDLIPDEEDVTSGGISDEWASLSAIVDSIDVADAYDRWIGKGKVNRKPGEVKIRCPFPHHEDKDPSASMKISEGVWMCHACDVGGGKFELAAIHFGYSFEDIKGKDFANLKRDIAEDLGWISAGQTPKGEPRYLKPGTQDPIIEEIQAPTEVPPPPDEPEAPSFDWREILPVNTPLHEWMLATSKLRTPDEYLFFGGLQIMGLAAGRDMYWLYEAKEIYPNLYVLLIGSTATGKSRCCYLMGKVISEALPFEADVEHSMGVLAPGTPASGEGVLTAMSPVVDDMDDEGRPQTAKRVKAWWHIDEFAVLASHKGRSGDNTEHTLMELFDNPPMRMTNRAKRTDNTVVEEPFTSVISTVQAAVVNKYMERADVHSGSANRWLPVHGSAKPRQRMSDYMPNLDPFIQGLRSRQDWLKKQEGLQIALTPEANDRWYDFCMTYIEPLLDKEDDPMDSIYGRTEIIMLKIALILHLNEIDLKKNKNQLDLGTLDRALQLWPYILGAYNHLVGRIQTGDSEEKINKVREILRSHGEMKQSQLTRSARPLDTATVNWVIDQLKKSGEVDIGEIGSTPKGGRPAKVIYWMG